MILSMTGYGKAESQIENSKLTVEIRSLNSKSMDLNMRLSPQLREYEHDIRTLLNQRLERGKVDAKIDAVLAKIDALLDENMGE